MVESTKKRAEGEQKVGDTASLARYLGLSRWTVSRALNGQPGVKDATRKRVEAAVEELGFQPNRMARSLRGAPSRLVGICFHQLEAPILTRKSAVLQGLLKGHGYRGIFELPGWDKSLEAEVLRHFQSIGVDGIVMMGSIQDNANGLITDILESGIAVVAIDPRENLPCAQVHLDRAYAMESLLRHLYHLGHRKFAMLGFESDEMYLEQRMEGVRRGCRELGLSLEEDFHHYHDLSYDQQDYAYGMSMAEGLLKSESPRPTGLIALNDRIAIGAIKQLRKKGYEVPRDFSIVGFDNLEESDWWIPSITSVDQNLQKFMETTIELLMEEIETPGHYHRYNIEPRVIERESSGPAKQILIQEKV